MIYATMCIGQNWIDKYKDIINEFSKSNTIHILTDVISEFNNTNVHLYQRDVFSYYEKINFILDLVKEYNQRITYIDCDWLSTYNTLLEYDNNSLYTYRIFDLDEYNDVTEWFTDIERDFRKSLLTDISSKGFITEYVPEALISFPNLKNIDDIISDIKTLQPIIEKTYNKESLTTPRLNRYKHGIGYAEGWSISAVSVKYDIPLKIVDRRKKTLI